MTEMEEIIKKAKSAGNRVFSAKVAGVETIYRSLGRKEFRDIQKKLADKTDALRKSTQEGVGVSDSQLSLMKEEGEEQLVMRGVLFPRLDTELDLAMVPAGFVPTIAELIMEASGFGEEVSPKEL